MTEGKRECLVSSLLHVPFIRCVRVRVTNDAWNRGVSTRWPRGFRSRDRQAWQARGTVSDLFRF